MRIKIGNKIISESSPVFIVAEIGLNHNGKIKLAKDLILEAKKCGADAVKFQTYKTELFINKKYAKDQYEIFKKYELKFDDFVKIKEFADKVGIIFFSTPFDFESANFLIKLKVPAIKVASSELSNIYFLKYLAKAKLPLFISTGMSAYKEIKHTYKIISRINKKIILLYCVSDYPLNPKDANMNSILFLKKKFKTIIGFSDHSEGFLLDVIATAFGAKIIEKHFTLDKNQKGPDHKFSLTPSEMKTMIENIRDTENSLGKGGKLITKNEKIIKKYALKGIYAKEDILAGEKITYDKIILQRPMKGIPASEVEEIKGNIAKRDIFKGEYISKADYMVQHQ